MAEDVKLVLRYRVEANAPLAYQKPILLMEGDKRANVLQISLFDGEKAVDLAGLSVGGSVLRADGADVAIEGEIDGNVISCVLSEYAYAVAGPFKAFVQLLDSLGNVKRTVLLLAGIVEERGHGPQIDTGKELPSLDDILAQLETMRNVTQAANAAAGDANTAAAAANNAASAAGTAAASATSAASSANTAADRANDAAQNWEEGTVKNAESLGGVPAASYALKTDTAPNANKLGGLGTNYYLKTTDAVEILPSATYAVGAALPFSESPDNFLRLSGRINYSSFVPNEGQGSGSNRRYILSTLTYYGTELDASQVIVQATILGTNKQNDFILEKATRVTLNRDGTVVTSSLNAVQLGVIYGKKYL